MSVVAIDMGYPKSISEKSKPLNLSYLRIKLLDSLRIITS